MIIRNQIHGEDYRPRLALRKETLRQLTDVQLQQVAGGMRTTLTSGTVLTRTIGCRTK
jgi:hypothetical protein